MGFTCLSEQYPVDKRSGLAELLREFIELEELLAQETHPHGKNKILREVRTSANQLREPPWSLSVDTLVEICDDTTSWLSSIELWKEFKK